MDGLKRSIHYLFQPISNFSEKKVDFMIISNSILSKIIDLCNKSSYLSKHKYDDHISYVYPICIIKVYQERIFIIYITDSGNTEEDIVRISDIGFIEDILSHYSYHGHITSEDVH